MGKKHLYVNGENREMSEYYKGLDSIAKARYQEKLNLLGLNEREDPYDPQNSSKFIDDDQVAQN